MKTYKLDRTDLENIEDLIPSIEKMYKFKFETAELSEVKNFDQLCELIIDKINLENVESCSSQQAFYKLRKYLDKENIYKKDDLTLETNLEDIFPRKNRIRTVKQFEIKVGFKLNILAAPSYIQLCLAILFLVSIVFLFVNWKFAIIGFVVCTLGFKLCSLFGKELTEKKVKDLVYKITTENYLDIRRGNTINRKEFKKLVVDWFSENLAIEKDKLTTSTFV